MSLADYCPVGGVAMDGRSAWGLLFVCLFSNFGCQSVQQYRTEVPIVEEFVVPPNEDRFNNPPEKAYRKPPPKKEFTPGMGGMGAPGMGGMGPAGF